jgi:hypothetical protein
MLSVWGSAVARGAQRLARTGCSTRRGPGRTRPRVTRGASACSPCAKRPWRSRRRSPSSPFRKLSACGSSSLGVARRARRERAPHPVGGSRASESHRRARCHRRDTARGRKGRPPPQSPFRGPIVPRESTRPVQTERAARGRFGCIQVRRPCTYELSTPGVHPWGQGSRHVGVHGSHHQHACARSGISRRPLIRSKRSSFHVPSFEHQSSEPDE